MASTLMDHTVYSTLIFQSENSQNNETVKTEPQETLKETDGGEFHGLSLDKETMTKIMHAKMQITRLHLARLSEKIFHSCNILSSSFGQNASPIFHLLSGKSCQSACAVPSGCS